jgi:hypothetical protein
MAIVDVAARRRLLPFTCENAIQILGPVATALFHCTNNKNKPVAEPS